MILDLVLVVFGLVMLLGGGDLLVRGASRLAHALGVSPLAVGLTVVAFGTSAPELSVNVMAAVRDNGEISFGNIVGSNLANIGLIFGLAALLRPIAMDSIVVRREIPMMLLATAAAMGMAFDHWFDDQVTAFNRGDGFVLLLFFVVFLYYTIGDVLRHRRNGRTPIVLPEGVLPPPSGDVRVPVNAALVGVGLALLILGGDVTVDAAVSLAEAAGVPQVVIGLTLVAVGTSLPELAATGMAVWRNESAMAVGNVVGSNIFNLLLVGGVTALVRPIPIPPGAAGDLLMLGVLSTVLWLACLGRGQKVLRAEAAGLLALYLGYMVYRTVG